MSEGRTFELAGQTIRWSFFFMVKKQVRDPELAARFFLRAVEKKAVNIVKWIQAGMVRNGHCWNACALESDNPTACRKWIDEHFASAKPGPMEAKVALVAELENMIKHLKEQ